MYRRRCIPYAILRTGGEKQLKIDIRNLNIWKESPVENLAETEKKNMYLPSDSLTPDIRGNVKKYIWFFAMYHLGHSAVV